MSTKSDAYDRRTQRRNRDPGLKQVFEGSNGVHLKTKIQGGGLAGVAYIPYPNLAYVYHNR